MLVCVNLKDQYEINFYYKECHVYKLWQENIVSVGNIEYETKTVKVLWIQDKPSIVFNDWIVHWVRDSEKPALTLIGKYVYHDDEYVFGSLAYINPNRQYHRTMAGSSFIRDKNDEYYMSVDGFNILRNPNNNLEMLKFNPESKIQRVDGQLCFDIYEKSFITRFDRDFKYITTFYNENIITKNGLPGTTRNGIFYYLPKDIKTDKKFKRCEFASNGHFVIQEDESSSLQLFSIATFKDFDLFVKPLQQEILIDLWVLSQKFCQSVGQSSCHMQQTYRKIFNKYLYCQYVFPEIPLSK